HALARVAELALELGLVARAGAEAGGDVVTVAVDEHPALDLRRALAARLARGDRGVDQLVELAEGRLGGLQRPLERALEAIRQQLLEAPRGPRRALRCFSNCRHRLGPT